MQTWKQTAKEFISLAKEIEAIQLMEANGVTVGSLKDDALRLKAEEDTLISLNLMWPDGRLVEWLDECTSIRKRLQELIDAAA